MSKNPIEVAAENEFRSGVSAGAAARQLCRELGCTGAAPTLKRMLEELLADANHRAHDRYAILRDFRNASPIEGEKARAASFLRVNHRQAAGEKP